MDIMDVLNSALGDTLSAEEQPTSEAKPDDTIEKLASDLEKIAQDLSALNLDKAVQDKGEVKKEQGKTAAVEPPQTDPQLDKDQLKAVLIDKILADENLAKSVAEKMVGKGE